MGSLAAIAMAGCLLGTILRRDSDVATSPRPARLGLDVHARPGDGRLVTDTFEGINKIGATPAWCFWSAAFTVIVWILLYRIIDVAGYRGWSILIRPAGANPLVAYFLHPIVGESLSLAGLGGTVLNYQGSPQPWIVIAGSLGMAVFVCAVTGLLGRLGLRVRL